MRAIFILLLFTIAAQAASQPHWYIELNSSKYHGVKIAGGYATQQECADEAKTRVDQYKPGFGDDVTATCKFFDPSSK